MKVQQLDVNMGWNSPDKIEWHNPAKEPFRIEGFAFMEQDNVFRRLPLNSENIFKTVNPNINDLSIDTAGGQIHFTTNSKTIAIKARIDSRSNMVNMTAAGQSGFDLYVRYKRDICKEFSEKGDVCNGYSEKGDGFKDSNEKVEGCKGEPYRFVGVTKFDITSTEYEVVVCDKLYEGEKDIILNFPLYMGVDSVLVGVEPNSLVKSAPPHGQYGKMVFYGTSITQGGCASRPGMCYTNILSRKLDCEAVNLGFSGNGLGEYEVAQIIAQIKDARLIVLDYEANAGTNGRLKKSLAGFIDIIRSQLKDAPIFIVSRIPYYGDFYDPAVKALRDDLREFQKTEVEGRNKQGDKNIYFINGYGLLPADFFEFTVDGIHPTDLGFYSMAENLYKHISPILSANNTAVKK